MTRPLPPDLLGAALASAGLALVPYPPPQTGTWTTKTGTSCHTSPCIAPCAARSIAVGSSRSAAGSERTAECALTPAPAARTACVSVVIGTTCLPPAAAKWAQGVRMGHTHRGGKPQSSARPASVGVIPPRRVRFSKRGRTTPAADLAVRASLWLRAGGPAPQGHRRHPDERTQRQHRSRGRDHAP
jgi:hypothetical protein